jgi:phosphohistidine swiveling domain-containing protein
MDMDDLVVSLDELARAPRPVALVGGKAANLGRLMAAGVAVPPGWVLTTAAHALPEPAREAAIAALCDRVQAVPGLLAVRSSSTIEDRPGAAAPGIFVSRLGVPASELDAAVRAVWASSEAPLVRAYAEARGIERIGMAVVVQPAIAGELAGVAYTRLPGRPEADEMLLETYGRPDAPATALRLARDSAAVLPAGGAPPLIDPARLAALVRAVLAAEAAIGAATGADVEWVIAGEQVWIVQARPVVHPASAPAPAFPAALLAFSTAQPDMLWRWDVAHNPDPLSPAQAGLVERMDAAGVMSARMRVVGGHLYYGKARAPAAASEPSPNTPPKHSTGTSPDTPPETPADVPAGAAEALRRRFEATWRPAMEAALAEAEAAAGNGTDASGPAPAAPDLARVLAAYERFYAVYAGELAAVLAAARLVLPAFLARHLPDRDPEAEAGVLLADASDARLETWIARVAQGAASFEQLMAQAGPMAPAWDVAAPTFAERPALLHRAVAAAAARPTRPADTAAQARAQMDTLDNLLGPEQRESFARCLSLARVARDLGELDDQLFARAQAAVRRALLGLARAWRLPEPDDVFYVPLDQVLAWATAEPPAIPAVRRLAQAGRAARERQRAWAMPLAFAAGEPVPAEDASPSGPDARDARTPGRSHDAWRGRGTGGRARGIAVRVTDLGDLTARDLGLPGAGAVLVVPTLTPAMAVLLHGVVAVVTEHGGLLDHGAAMARELGLPCVVGCAGVSSQIRAGDSLLVDGEAGLVLRLAAGELPP